MTLRIFLNTSVTLTHGVCSQWCHVWISPSREDPAFQRQNSSPEQKRDNKSLFVPDGKEVQKRQPKSGSATLVLLVAWQRTPSVGQHSIDGGDIREQATGDADVPRIMGASLA